MSSDSSAAKKASRPSGASIEPAKMTVLVVDDDVAIRVLVRGMLEAAGYEVAEAASGRDALIRLRGGALPHYLVTDLKMADGSGGWLVSQVGYEFPSLLSRTVVITGDAKGAGAAHVAARWGCPVLAKPLTGQALLSALRRSPDDSIDP
jgi:two-component system, chemotaxis family, chemotaxis protein CheY